MEITDLFNQFQTYAFRLEALPRYVVDSEVEAIAYFSKHGKLPAGHNDDWADLIQDNLQAGKKMERLRLFTLPLNDYETFERVVYEINIDAGEEIRVNDRAKFQDAQDFWAFDDEWIARMIYDKAGAWHGAEVSPMSEDDKQFVGRWREAFLNSPLMREGSPLR